jgi:hypothetical protein
MLNRVFRVEDVADLFQGTTTCLDKEEVDENEFENVPEYKQEVILLMSISESFLIAKQSGWKWRK